MAVAINVMFFVCEKHHWIPLCVFYKNRYQKNKKKKLNYVASTHNIWQVDIKQNKTKPQFIARFLLFSKNFSKLFFLKKFFFFFFETYYCNKKYLSVVVGSEHVLLCSVLFCFMEWSMVSLIHTRICLWLINQKCQCIGWWYIRIRQFVKKTRN